MDSKVLRAEPVALGTCLKTALCLWGRHTSRVSPPQAPVMGESRESVCSCFCLTFPPSFLGTRKGWLDPAQLPSEFSQWGAL